MAKRQQSFLDWLCSHGIMLAYGAILSVVMAAATVGLLTVVLFLHWWEKVR